MAEAWTRADEAIKPSKHYPSFMRELLLTTETPWVDKDISLLCLVTVFLRLNRMGTRGPGSTYNPKYQVARGVLTRTKEWFSRQTTTILCPGPVQTYTSEYSRPFNFSWYGRTSFANPNRNGSYMDLPASTVSMLPLSMYKN